MQTTSTTDDSGAPGPPSPFGLVVSTLIQSPVINRIHQFGLGGGRRGVVIVKEASIELHEIREIPSTSPAENASPEYVLELLFRASLFQKLVSSHVIPYSIEPFLPQGVRDKRSRSVSTDVSRETHTTTDTPTTACDSFSPMSIDDANSVNKETQSSNSRQLPVLEELSDNSTSDTLILVTTDRHLLFVVCDCKDDLIVVKNLELSNAPLPLVYDYDCFDTDDEFPEVQMNDYLNDLIPEYERFDTAISSILGSPDEDIASTIKQLGKELASDESGSAVLVSSYQNIYKVITLRPIGIGRSRYVMAAHQFEVDGVMLHSQFLYSPASPAFAIYYIDERRTPKLEIFEWIVYNSPKKIKRVTSLVVPSELPLPLFMIPLRHDRDLLFVTESQLHLYTSEGTGSWSYLLYRDCPKYARCDRALPTAYDHPKHSTSGRLWQQLRDCFSEDVRDYVYLAFESGDIFIVAVLGDGQLAMIHYMHIDTDIGTSFSVIENSGAGPDLVFAAGDLVSGGIFAINSSTFFRRDESEMSDGAILAEPCQALSKFLNWAPILDCQVVKPAGSQNHRLFLNSGYNQRGSVTQIRYGISAQVVINGPLMRGLSNIFVLSSVCFTGFFLILTSTPWQSRLLIFDQKNSRLSTFDLAGFEALSETLHARVLPSGYLIQVTRSALIASDIIGTGPGFVLSHDKGEQVSHAVVDIDGCCSTVVIGKCYSDSYQLVCYHIPPSGSEKIEILQLPGETTFTAGSISFLKLIDIGNTKICMVGTHEPSIRVLRVDPESGLSDIQTIRDLSGSIMSGIPESVAVYCLPITDPVICSESYRYDGRMTIGLRNGLLLVGSFTMNLSADYADLDFHLKSTIRMGDMPVKLRDTSDPGRAYAMSELLWSVSMDGSDNEDWFQINQVIFDDFQDQSVFALQTLNDISFMPNKNLVAGLLQDRFFIAEIGSDLTECIFQSPVRETLKRMVYFDHVKALVATRDLPFNRLVFIDVASQKVLESTPTDSLIPPSEEIQSINEWHAQMRSRECHFLIMGTAIRSNGNAAAAQHNSSHRQDRGKIRVFRIRRTSHGASGMERPTFGAGGLCDSSPPGGSSTDTGYDEPQSTIPIELEIKKQFSWTTPEAVIAVAKFKDLALVYSAGNKVYVKMLNIDTVKFDFPAIEVTLRSPAINFSVENNLIFASTRSNSIVVIAYAEGSLVIQESDAIARSMLHHHQYLSNFVIGTDKDHAIFGLRSQNERTHFSNMELQFKCVLPTAISRLRRGNFVAAHLCAGNKEREKSSRDSTTATKMSTGSGAPSEGEEPSPTFEDVLIGTGINGSIYGFRILDEREFYELFNHLKALVAELAQRYSRLQRQRLQQMAGRSSAFTDTTFPLQLGLIPNGFGLSGLLHDVGFFAHGYAVSKQHISEDSIVDSAANLSSLPQASVKKPSIRQIDGDVMLYLHELRKILASEYPPNDHQERESSWSMSEHDGAASSVSMRTYGSRYSSTSFGSREVTEHGSSIDGGGQFCSQSWIDCYLKGIVL
ncbi:mono-functional DNA-alkylating methyl methanesulfonate N-term-domain-containing protein [Myxozyma melibiosi]|uniref:Mono-functional DNA-alkylating methyl methanesulfonate N-term-domain-containing protein n=1 Tax=Myxozyma melibiosi TaxID=54550 RepID=A0ABR1F3L5_9ASCO